MLSKQEQGKLRNRLFRHLDGIVMVPLGHALLSKGVTQFILSKEQVALKELSQEFGANEGYLNVALRSLCSQGWLIQEVDNTENSVVYRRNALSERAFSYFHLYEDAFDLITLSGNYSNRVFQKEPFLKLESIFQKYQNHYGMELSSNAIVGSTI